ncbi:MAG: tetratricopeptide repeat protein [Pseudomonadota bacterium]
MRDARNSFSKIFISVGIFYLFLVPASAGSLEDALAAADRGDDVIAVQLFHTLAEKGNARAQYFLGVMHDLGRGVPEDDVQAANWYRKAAEQGDAEAQFMLERMNEHGHGVQPD